MKMKSVHLEDLLRHRDTDTQLATLQIVYKMLKLLTPEQIQYIVRLTVGVFDKHQSEECRVSCFILLRIILLFEKI